MLREMGDHVAIVGLGMTSSSDMHHWDAVCKCAMSLPKQC